MAGNLDDIRDGSRAAIHAKFALPAVVSSGGSTIGPAHVRLHSADSRAFGDLDREGYAFSVEGKHILVFDTEEFVPQYKQQVDIGRGRVYVIDHIFDNKDRNRYVRCVVSEVLP